MASSSGRDGEEEPISVTGSDAVTVTGQDADLNAGIDSLITSKGVG